MFIAYFIRFFKLINDFKHYRKEYKYMLDIIKVIAISLGVLLSMIMGIFLASISLPLGFAFFGLIAVIVIIVATRRVLVAKGLIIANKRHTKKINKIQFNTEFKDMYNHLHSRYSGELEVMRKKLKSIIFVSSLLFVVSAIIFVGFIIILDVGNRTVTDRNNQEFLFIITFLPATIYFLTQYRKHIGIYKDRYKETVISNFVKLVNHNLQHTPNGNSRMEQYYESANFKDRSYNKFNCNDYISGYFDNGISIEIANICLQALNRHNSVVDTPFIGLFSYSLFNNGIDKELRIKKNKIRMSRNFKQVKMDSSEFAKYFDVFCESNILAMQFLTHDVMEEILTFYLMYKLEFEIIIVRNSICIRFHTGSMFEPEILRKSTNKKTLWTYYTILKFVVSFTVKMNKLIKDIES
jgi:hypothetical protein